MYLAKMTTAQAKEAFKEDPIIVIPVGSTEQHGTQGALGTDFMVPSYLADHVEDIDNVIVAPTVPYRPPLRRCWQRLRRGTTPAPAIWCC